MLSECQMVLCGYPNDITVRNSSVATSRTVRRSNPVGARFSYLCRPALGSTQPPVQWVPGLIPGGKAAGAWR
jgi:hypothetical protein